jgi:hypothetical protein
LVISWHNSVLEILINCLRNLFFQRHPAEKKQKKS